MPATEQTWRNQKVMHVIFGVSGIAMLVTTIWMLAVDHNREWKPIQRKFRDIESWFATARINEQETAEYETQTQDLQAKLDAARSQPPPAAGVESFLQVAQSKVEAPADVEQSYADQNGYDVKAVEEAYASLLAQPTIAGYDKLIDKLEDIVTLAQFVEDTRSQELKFKKAILSVAVSTFNLAVGAKTDAELAQLQAEVDQVQKEVDRLTIAYEDANTHRLALSATLDGLNAPAIAAKKALADHQSTLEALQKTLKEREMTAVWHYYKPGKDFLTLPILDAFDDPLKIENQWLPKLTFNNNFRDVARFDRCATCHLAMDKTAPGSAVEPGYRPQMHDDLVLFLETPEKDPHQDVDEEGNPIAPTYDRLFGIQLASQGLIDDDDVTVSVVRPKSPGRGPRTSRAASWGWNRAT